MDIPIPTQEEDISVPLTSSNSSYPQATAAAAAVSHILHHPVPADLHHNHLTAPPLPPASNNNNNGPPDREVSPHHHNHHVVNVMGAAAAALKNVVKYRECLKNHAAAMGGNATDGCGEFMPSGEEGTIEALTCSACNCHRNFHRKEMEGDHHHQLQPPCDWPQSYGHSPQHLNRLIGRKVIRHHHNNMLPHDALVYPTGAVIAAPRGATPHQMIMPYNMAAAGSLPSTESDEQVQEDGGVRQQPAAAAAHHLQMVKKRFRTKFTQEQKEKMLNFAEKVGWKIQRQEESVVQHFCQEIGVKRRVLKVWMHNNKHNLAKQQQQQLQPY